MKFAPRPFQQAGIDHAAEFLGTAAPGAMQLYAAPTGSGKSVVILGVQARIPGSWVVTPREEIVEGMREKGGTQCITTPIRLRNMLFKGEIPTPTALLFDETHHHNADSWQQLHLLAGLAPAVGYTASPYRGNPRSTREFLEHWGEPLWLITYKEAVAEGYISMPTFHTLPLVDDDMVDVKNGEFDITELDSRTVDRLGDMAEHARTWYSTLWDQPTVFALPSTVTCTRLQQELGARGLPSIVVRADMPREERYQAFQLTVNRVAALLHINIVSEGVDLPIRRVVDLAPTMSPVKWVQQLGRCTRPAPAPPQYVCTNRNVVRHGYVLEGAVPYTAYADAEQQFGPSKARGHARVLGLEALGRFKPVATRLLSGSFVYTYALSTVSEAGHVTDYCAIVHPAMDPVWCSRETPVVDGVRKWGKWAACEPPADLKGFSSVPQRELSPKQLAFWSRSAAGFGLDPEQDVNRKSFQALPVLCDLGLHLR